MIDKTPIPTILLLSNMRERQAQDRLRWVDCSRILAGERQKQSSQYDLTQVSFLKIKQPNL